MKMMEPRPPLDKLQLLSADFLGTLDPQGDPAPWRLIPVMPSGLDFPLVVYLYPKRVELRFMFQLQAFRPRVPGDVSIPPRSEATRLWEDLYDWFDNDCPKTPYVGMPKPVLTTMIPGPLIRYWFAAAVEEPEDLDEVALLQNGYRKAWALAHHNAAATLALGGYVFPFEAPPIDGTFIDRVRVAHAGTRSMLQPLVTDLREELERPTEPPSPELIAELQAVPFMTSLLNLYQETYPEEDVINVITWLGRHGILVK